MGRCEPVQPAAVVHHSSRMRVHPDGQAALPWPSKPQAKLISRPRATGRSNSDQFGALRPPAAPGAGGRTPRCTRLQTQVREDLLDHRASKIAAMIFNSPPQFGPFSRSRSKTRLSSLSLLSRVGRWCAQFASHSAGAARRTGATGCCGPPSHAVWRWGQYAMKAEQVQPWPGHHRSQQLHEL